MPERRLLLVDAANLLYRAFFAIQGLSTQAGRPTNAVFGFIRTLKQLERLWRPSHWVVVFDGGVPRERLELQPSYKANRPPMPDALREQFAPVEEYLERAGIPKVRAEEFEADDVIASLIARLEGEVEEILVVTSDKDIFQLVSDRVAVVLPSKADAKMGPQEVLEKTGVPPSRIVEFLALTGDEVDNVPGVPGIGPKTAAKLLAGPSPLADFLSDPARAGSDKTRRMFEEHKDLIRRNLETVRLRRDVQGLPGLSEMTVRPPSPSRLLPLLEELEFHSMAEELRTRSLFEGPDKM